MNNKVLFSTGKVEWETPKDFFDNLDKEFHFTLDPCATNENHKCDTYFTREQDGLKQNWEGHTVFCNPPLWPKRDWSLGEKMCRGVQTLSCCCYADSGKN